MLLFCLMRQVDSCRLRGPAVFLWEVFCYTLACGGSLLVERLVVREASCFVVRTAKPATCCLRFEEFIWLLIGYNMPGTFLVGVTMQVSPPAHVGCNTFLNCALPPITTQCRTYDALFSQFASPARCVTAQAVSPLFPHFHARANRSELDPNLLRSPAKGTEQLVRAHRKH